MPADPTTSGTEAAAVGDARLTAAHVILTAHGLTFDLEFDPDDPGIPIVADAEVDRGHRPVIEDGSWRSHIPSGVTCGRVTISGKLRRYDVTPAAGAGRGDTCACPDHTFDHVTGINEDAK